MPSPGNRSRLTTRARVWMLARSCGLAPLQRARFCKSVWPTRTSSPATDIRRMVRCRRGQCLHPCAWVALHMVASKLHLPENNRPAKHAGQASSLVQSHMPALQTAQAEPPYRLLVYEYVPDVLEKRGPHREAHLAAAQQLSDAGKCLLGGAAGNPPSQGIFVMHGMSEQVRARQF